MDPFGATVAAAFHTPSMQGIEDTFVQNVRTHLNKFLELWQKFGLEEDRMSSRLDELWAHFRTLLGQMYEEDFASYQKVVKRIKARSEAVEGLAKLLQVEAKNGLGGPLFQKEKVLDEELERLKSLKKERQETYSRLKGEELEHRGAMLLEPLEGRARNRVPSEQEVQGLKQRVAALGEERERRRTLFEKGREELAAALRRGEWAPQTAFERHILASEGPPPLSIEAVDLLEATLERVRRQAESFESRRKTLVEKLKRLWRTLEVEEPERIKFREDSRLQTLASEVERLEEVRRIRIGPLVSEQRRELEELWDKCHVPESERRKFRAYSFSEMDGDVLELHEDEAEKWRRHHEDVRPILQKINKRQRLWDEMVALETNAGNPDRFKNRRGNLLAEEKERKRLQKELPSLENDIFKDMEEHELLSGTPFLYYGEDYRNFVSNQWAQRLNQKEFQKLERRRQRSLEPTEVTTPTRRVSGTPGATPKKVSRSSLGSSAPCTPSNRANAPVVGRLFSPRSAQKEDRAPASESHNGTTYTDFADGLDQSNFHSSAIENSKRGRAGRGGRGKKVGILRKSLRNTAKAVAKFTPKRGKLGLPFLI